jgi:drug/metabolite transporter (DMT)-like permease
VTAALLALAGALSWGVGDFFGGLSSRRLHVLTVLSLSQAVGLAGVLLWVLATRDEFPGVGQLAPAAAAGLAGAIGLAALYRGMALGAMGIVAPISAASPVVPLVVDATKGVVPSGAQCAGIALVLSGIAVLSHERSPETGSRVAAGAGLALVAALGFGLFVVGLDAGADESAPWAVVAARTTSVMLCVGAAAVAAAPLRAPRALLPMVLAVGLFDTSANVLVAFAVTLGAAGIVAVLSALYPVATITLARVALHERLDNWRRAGAALALGGAALVAAG